jgi:regulatory protein
MTVTLVTYNGDLVKLVFDTADALVLPVKIEYSPLFSKGAQITRERFEELLIVSESCLCTRSMIGYLARGAKTVFLLTQYLKKKEYTATAIASAIDYAKEHGYLDDADYARRFIRTSKRRKAVGALRIKSELMKKGVSKEIADQALKDTGFSTDDYDEVYAAAEKKMKSVAGKKNPEQKLAYFLRSRGFRDDLARKAVRQLVKEGKMKEEEALSGD